MEDENCSECFIFDKYLENKGTIEPVERQINDLSFDSLGDTKYIPMTKHYFSNCKSCNSGCSNRNVFFLGKQQIIYEDYDDNGNFFEILQLELVNRNTAVKYLEQTRHINGNSSSRIFGRSNFQETGRIYPDIPTSIANSEGSMKTIFSDSDVSDIAVTPNTKVSYSSLPQNTSTLKTSIQKSYYTTILEIFPKLLNKCNLLSLSDNPKVKGKNIFHSDIQSLQLQHPRNKIKTITFKNKTNTSVKDSWTTVLENIMPKFQSKTAKNSHKNDNAELKQTYYG
ncbi:hypothetical protein, no similarity [Maudiozyma barnettii]|uniref:Uncharacterized protein n=1 Tax=Maudiozyma barnettii TaxID=61262 RepID=A0A8H2VKS1_9SACH|nr:hypothetical protein, no similarity [Kazachstania barnettii]CAB4257170.1 hypothetical protein, no similarity [Kazachstania barnettii]CAD1779540.1 hypothetical protein, no similarity [Kazachstania barnettii]